MSARSFQLFVCTLGRGTVDATHFPRGVCRQGGPYAKQCQDVYSKLRSNILTNMWRQFDSPQNQFIWENYSDVDGSGQGTHPMGWSSLVALIALERY